MRRPCPNGILTNGIQLSQKSRSRKHEKERRPRSDFPWEFSFALSSFRVFVIAFLLTERHSRMALFAPSLPPSSGSAILGVNCRSLLLFLRGRRQSLRAPVDQAADAVSHGGHSVPQRAPANRCRLDSMLDHGRARPLPNKPGGCLRGRPALLGKEFADEVFKILPDYPGEEFLPARFARLRGGLPCRIRLRRRVGRSGVSRGYRFGHRCLSLCCVCIGRVPSVIRWSQTRLPSYFMVLRLDLGSLPCAQSVPGDDERGAGY